MIRIGKSAVTAMRSQIAHSPTFTTLELTFSAGESILVQPGCMLAMTTGFELKAGLGSHMTGQGRLGRATRSVLAGESFVTAMYTAKRDAERLTLAPDQMGEIRELHIGSEPAYCIASGAFLACTSGIQISLEFAGVRGWLATRGLFLMRPQGDGSLFISSYGALVEIDLQEGERYVLDNRYIVAFSASLRFETVKVASSLRHSYLSGEGLVNRFTGPGKLLYQTRARPGRGFMRSMLDVAT